MVVRGRFALPMQTISFSVFFKCSNNNYMYIDSQRIILNHDINCISVENKLKV